MPDFRTLLSVKASEVKKPPPVPQGTYLCQIEGHKLGEARNEEKTELCTITYLPITAMEDVDQTELGNYTSVRPLNKTKLSRDFWLTEAALYRLTEHLINDLKIDPDLTIMEQLSQVKGLQVLVNVGHRINPKDPNEVFTQINSFAPVE